MDIGWLFGEFLFVLLVAVITATLSSLIMLGLFRATRTLYEMDIFWVMYVTWIFWFLTISVIGLAAQSDRTVRLLTDFWPLATFTLGYLIAFYAIFSYTQSAVQTEINREIGEQKKIVKDRQQKLRLKLLEQQLLKKK